MKKGSKHVERFPSLNVRFSDVIKALRNTFLANDHFLKRQCRRINFWLYCYFFNFLVHLFVIHVYNYYLGLNIYVCIFTLFLLFSIEVHALFALKTPMDLRLFFFVLFTFDNTSVRSQGLLFPFYCIHVQPLWMSFPSYNYWRRTDMNSKK